MIAFFSLIRWKNLLFILLAQILIKYALLEALKPHYNFDTALTHLGFITLVVATLCIAAAGYIINDIEDVDADTINKPKQVIIGKHISEHIAMQLFVTLNCIGVVLGYILSHQLERKGFVILFILTAALLYWYSVRLKKIAVIGNSVVAVLVGLSILIVGIFDLIPVLSEHNKSQQIFFLQLILDYAIFAFIINIVRELVKDIEDINGDYKLQSKSLPIILGRQRATKITFVLALIATLLLITYVTNNLYKQPIAITYALVFLVAPMLYITIKLFSAKTKNHYSHISTILKRVMLFGVLSLLLYQFML